MTYTLVLERRNTFYLVSLILPVMFLSLTAALVFALPAGTHAYTDRQTFRHSCKQTHRPLDEQVGRRTDGQTDRWTDA